MRRLARVLIFVGGVGAGAGAGAGVGGGAGCGAHGDDPAHGAPAAAPAATAGPIDAGVAPPDAGPPVETTHVIVRGDKLDDLAKARYGSRHYSRVIAAVDRVEATKLRIGATLALPSVEEILAPIAKRAPDAAAALLRAHAAWTSRVDALWDAHRKSRTHQMSGDPTVARAASDAEAARVAFGKAGAPTKALAALVATLDQMAGEHVDPEGYAIDDVDRRFADSLAVLVEWARR